jgi:two-component system, OmpR family, copper resistance phosphate regulon response regulator CusR
MKVLICEDEVNVASFIRRGLTENGFDVDVVHDGQHCLERVEKEDYDILLLDVIMPGKNGLEVSDYIRKVLRSEMPIIMLTALNSTEQVVKGLNTGADDYLAKPFKMEELIARMNALKRRYNMHVPSTGHLEFMFVRMDRDTKEVTLEGRPISLTAKEYKLLEFFLQNPRVLLTRDRMLEVVWGINFDVGTNIVDVYMNYLRGKLEQFGHPRIVQTRVGMGYILKEPNDA